MIEPLGILAYELILELLLASALVWIAVAAVTRLLGITDGVWLVRFSLLPILVPIVLVPMTHLIIRPHMLNLPSVPLENFMSAIAHASPIVATVFLGMAGLVLLSAAIYILHPLVAIVRYRLVWRCQQKESSPWLRCNRILCSIAPKLQIPPPRLIMTEDGSCGSLSFGPMVSYIVVSKSWVSKLDDEELEGLLSHELSHIRRNDSLIGIIVGICHRLLAFSPFAQSAFRNFSRAREEVVDDLAIRTSGRPVALASCLVKAYRLSQGEDYSAASTGFLSSAKSTEGRIRRLLETSNNTTDSPRQYHRLFYGVLAAVSTLLLVII